MKNVACNICLIIFCYIFPQTASAVGVLSVGKGVGGPVGPLPLHYARPFSSVKHMLCERHTRFASTECTLLLVVRDLFDKTYAFSTTHVFRSIKHMPFQQHTHFASTECILLLVIRDLLDETYAF